MAIFTVHVPMGIAEPKRRADRTVFLREGFSWAAFWFGPLALAYRRLWLEALAWIILAGVIAAVGHVFRLPPLSQTALYGLLALLTGFEADSLRRAALGRRGYVLSSILARPTRDAAEQAHFRGEGFRAPTPRPRQPGAPARGEPEVIGLFPHAGDLA